MFQTTVPKLSWSEFSRGFIRYVSPQLFYLYILIDSLLICFNSNKGKLMRVSTYLKTTQQHRATSHPSGGFVDPSHHQSNVTSVATKQAVDLQTDARSESKRSHQHEQDPAKTASVNQPPASATESVLNCSISSGSGSDLEGGTTSCSSSGGIRGHLRINSAFNDVIIDPVRQTAPGPSIPSGKVTNSIFSVSFL